MLSSHDDLPLGEVKSALRRLRQGQALAHPTSVADLDARLRRLLCGGQHDDGGPAEVMAVVDGLRRAIQRLGAHERQVTQVDFNLAVEHSFPTLTERQESLARVRGCAAKTIRRHSELALDTLATIIVADDPFSHPTSPPAQPTAYSTPDAATPPEHWRQDVARFWRLAKGTAVDIVCSEIPEPERPSFASPADRNYLRYAKFADLDSLIYVRTQIMQVCPDATVRDFAPAEHFGGDAHTLIVIGGPPWNAKFREFQPRLPFHFESHPLGQDDPLVVPQLNVRLAPRWTDNGELLDDVAVFTRLTLARGTTVYLLAGCLTLGVLAAAQCFLHGECGAENARLIDQAVGDADFVMATQARRVGGITDVTDLNRVKPLLLMARSAAGVFEVVDATNASEGIGSPQAASTP